MFEYKCMYFLKIFFMFEYKCMHLFSKTKCIFKYKCMHVFARGYGTLIHVFIINNENEEQKKSRHGH